MTAPTVGVAAVASILGLDDVHVGQSMVSRPIVLGPLLGLFLGQPASGLAMGVACELLSLDDLPMGNRMPLNTSVATAVAILLAAGDRGLVPDLALPAGLAAGWAHRHLESALRQRRRGLCGEAERQARDGKVPEFGRLAAKSLAEQAAVTFAFLCLVLFAGGPVLSLFWRHAPAAVRQGFGFAWAMAPWIGLGLLLNSLRVVPWRR